MRIITPYAQHAMSYLARGFNPLPIPAGLKHPIIKKWSVWKDQPIPAALAGELAGDSRNAGIGLCTGFGGLIGIDVDDDEAYPAVRQVFGPLKAPAKIGRRGATAFFHDPAGKIANMNLHAKPEGDAPVGRILVEILSAGRFMVIPPTIHPKTNRPYRWHNGDLESCRPEDLPVITAQMVDDLRGALGPLLAAPKPAPAISEETPRVIELDGILRLRMHKWADRALEQQVERFEGLQDGQQRNRALYQAICTLGRYVHCGVLSRTALTAAFLAAAEHNGLIEDKGKTDFLNTIARGLSRSANDELPVLQDRSPFAMPVLRRAGDAA